MAKKKAKKAVKRSKKTDLNPSNDGSVVVEGKKITKPTDAKTQMRA